MRHAGHDHARHARCAVVTSRLRGVCNQRTIRRRCGVYSRTRRVLSADNQQRRCCLMIEERCLTSATAPRDMYRPTRMITNGVPGERCRHIAAAGNNLMPHEDKCRTHKKRERHRERRNRVRRYDGIHTAFQTFGAATASDMRTNEAATDSAENERQRVKPTMSLAE